WLVHKPYLHHHMMQRGGEPYDRVHASVAARALPDLGFDIAEAQADRLGAAAPKAVVIDAARRRDAEPDLVLARRGEVELPQHYERIEGRQLERRDLVVVEQHDAAFPVERRRLVAIVVGAFDRI